MPKRIPPLPALRVFEAAARHASFAKAADELSVTPAAVSYQIKVLEQWLREPLFVRRARGIVLTEAGREYYRRIGDVFEALADTSNLVREHRVRPTVIIRAQYSLAAMWLTPRLGELAKQEPDVDIRLVSAGADRNLFKGGADIAVYQLADDAPDKRGTFRAELVRGNFRVYVGAAPSGRRTRTVRAVDLGEIPLLHTEVEDNASGPPTFADWFRAAGVRHERPLAGTRFNFMYLTAAACALGQGAALMLDAFCEPLVRSGALREVDGPALRATLPYSLCAHQPSRPEVKRVADFLLGHAQ